MKKVVLIILALALTYFAQAQRFGYVDTEYILDLMPEYKSAQKQLDQLSEDWQKEVEKSNKILIKCIAIFRQSRFCSLKT